MGVFSALCEGLITLKDVNMCSHGGFLTRRVANDIQDADGHITCDAFLKWWDAFLRFYPPKDETLKPKVTVPEPVLEDFDVAEKETSKADNELNVRRLSWAWPQRDHMERGVAEALRQRVRPRRPGDGCAERAEVRGRTGGRGLCDGGEHPQAIPMSRVPEGQAAGRVLRQGRLLLRGVGIAVRHSSSRTCERSLERRRSRR